MTILRLKQSSARAVKIQSATKDTEERMKTERWTHDVIEAVADQVFSENVGVIVHSIPIEDIQSEGKEPLRAGDYTRIDTGIPYEYYEENWDLTNEDFIQAAQAVLKGIKKDATLGISHIYTIEFYPPSLNPNIPHPDNLEVLVRFMH